jgi:hypothetical protein
MPSMGYVKLKKETRSNPWRPSDFSLCPNRRPNRFPRAFGAEMISGS